MRPKQSLGQNFLVDDNIARKIAAAINIQPDDVVIEIGPGKGSLTQHLVGKGKQLIAMEVDQRVVDGLKEKFEGDTVSILHQDFLEASLAELSKKFTQKLRLVGNIPYHLTSPILFKAFAERAYVSDVVMMIQKEVAVRLQAKPGGKDYGILAVQAAFHGKAKKLFDVSASCFFPRPKVESSVIHVTLADPPRYDVDPALFTKVVRTSFGKRRKTLKNSLEYLEFPEETVAAFLEASRDKLSLRPEQLSVEDFVILTRTLQKLL
jgi:16S rRNA (adenine1518-N6/adenine1519-N6)-dimethyltransferase